MADKNDYNNYKDILNTFDLDRKNLINFISPTSKRNDEVI